MRNSRHRPRKKGPPRNWDATASIGNLIAGCLEIIESAYRCPEWLEFGRSERTDQIRDALEDFKPHLATFRPSLRGSDPKTIDDVTLDEWAKFTEATIELLGAAVLMYWELNGPTDDDDDHSVKDAIEGVINALRVIGLPQPSLTEGVAKLDRLVRSNPGDPVFEEFAESLRKRE